MEMADTMKETDTTHFLSQNFLIALYAADKFGNMSQSMGFARAQKLRRIYYYRLSHHIDL